MEELALTNLEFQDIRTFLLQNQDKILTVESLDDKNLAALIELLLNSREFADVSISFKACTLEQKCTIVKLALESNIVFNKVILANVINVLKTYNSFTDDYFKESTVIFSNIEEFLDLKISLGQQIQDFIDAFAGYYMSLFLQVHNTTVNYLEKYVEIPMVFYTLLMSLDLYTISGICQKANRDKIKICSERIYNSNVLISSLFDKWKITTDFLKKFS